MIQLLHYRKLPVLFFFFSMLFLGGAVMAQRTWVGATNQAWNVGTNWAPIGVPGANEDVTINTSVTILFPGDFTVGSVTITSNAAVTFTPAAPLATRTLSLNNTVGAALNITAGSSLTLIGGNTGGTNRMILNYTAGAKTATIAGTLNLNTAGANDEGEYVATNSTTTVTGTVVNNGGLFNTTAANFVFSTGSIYNHAINAGTVPIAGWNTGSTCRISGMVANQPNFNTQTFSNIELNNPNQTGILEIRTASLTGVNGNFTITNTGPSGTVKLTDANTDGNLTVGGNFVMTGGQFYVEDNSNGGSTLTVNGNVSLSGSPNLVVSSNGGTATMTVGGNVTISGGSFNLSDAAGIGALNVAGNFSHTAGLLTKTGTGSGTINFNGTGATQTYTSGGTTVATDLINYAVAANAYLQMAAAGTVLSGAGTFTTAAASTLGVRSADGINSGTGITTGNVQVTGLRTYAVGSNIIYNGTAGAQNTGTGIPTAMTGTLTINNGSGVTLNGAESIGNGGNIVLQSGTFVTGTNLTLNTTCTITRNSGSITGTFQGTGDYNVVYTNGAASGPELQGGQGATRLNNLTINLPLSTQFVSLGAATEIKGLLTLTNGKLSTNPTNVLLMTATATSGGGSTSSFVNGPVRKTGTTAFIFPIGFGTGTDYRPIAVSGSNASIATAIGGAASTIEARLSLANPLKIFNKAYNGDMVSLSSCYYWQVDRTGAGAANVFIWASTGPSGGASLNSDYLRACMIDVPPTSFPVINPSLLRVARYNGTLWDNLNYTTSPQAPVTVQATNAWFIGANEPVTTFSPFGVGSAEGVLPVTLTAFSARKDGDAVKLSWETASEQNSAFFDVERSSDGVNFSSIGKVNAAGNSSTVRKYNFTDNYPEGGRNFYRLRQVDIDAEFEYSKTVSVNMNTNVAVTVSPNPVQDNMMVEYPKVGKGATYKVIAMDGKVMQTGTLQENSTQQSISLGTLQRGQYILMIKDNGQQYNRKVVKH